MPEDIPPEFGEGTYAIHKQTYRPKKLIRLAPGTILVENRYRK